jgi:UDP-glucose 4-epimerase
VGRNPIAGPVLVLGGAGFLGSHIVEALLGQGTSVRVFDRAGGVDTLPAGSSVEFIEGDFGNPDDVRAALAGCRTVVHLVGTTLPKTSNDDPIHDLESNLMTTVRFLELAREQRVDKIVFSSSGGTVYGLPTTIPIPEDHKTEPLCSYGIHKLTIERYLHLFHVLYGMDYCVLRLANPFGERQRVNGAQGAVAVFLDRALRDEELVVWGDGSAVRDYVYVGDVAHAFCQAAQHTGTPKIFNIGSGHGLSVNDLIAAIETVVGRPVSRRYVPERRFDVPANVLDISLAAAQLDWRPRCSFLDGLRRTLEWQLSQRAVEPGGALPNPPLMRR